VCLGTQCEIGNLLKLSLANLNIQILSPKAEFDLQSMFQCHLNLIADVISLLQHIFPDLDPP